MGFKSVAARHSFSNLKLKFLGTGLMLPEEVRIRYHTVFSCVVCV